MAKFKKGEQNGRPFTSETARKAQSKSVRAHYEKLHGREAARAFLEDARGVDDRVRDEMLAAGWKLKDINPQTAMLFRVSKRSQSRGDAFAFEKINKLAGYMTEETHSVNETRLQLTPLTKEQIAEMNKTFDEEF